VAGIALSFVAACDGVFGLQRVAPDAAPDAFVMHDEDGDGIDNLVDDCPAVFDQIQTIPMAITSAMPGIRIPTHLEIVSCPRTTSTEVSSR
jgi:hypothetical protein